MTGDRPLRVAFPAIPRRLWAGGYNYQRNLFAAVSRHCPGEIIPVVFAGAEEDPSDLAEISQIPAVEITRSAAFAFTDRHARLATAVILGLDRQAIAEFRARHIDVVFENARFFGWRLPLPAVAWFPDFQHRHLPHLFSSAGKWRRELGFRAQIRSGRHILLSSESALRDFRAFYPDATNAISVVRFATEPPASLSDDDVAKVLKKYDLPEKYFYLPNQFYRHKNHPLVIDALAILRERGQEVVVAASGSPEDLRDADYFDWLMRQVKDGGLGNSFCYLGMIPRDHVYALLCASVALINPSRFEGWSTTVEEGKSFGVPLILSDIAVHREQAGDAASYFSVDDPVMLADRLSATWQEATSPIIRSPLPDIDQRVAAFARDFVRAIRSAVRS